MGARVYVAGARVYARSFWWEPESMLLEPESMLGVMGWSCDFSVSPSPFGLDFGTFDFGLGLDNNFWDMEDICVYFYVYC